MITYSTGQSILSRLQQNINTSLSFVDQPTAGFHFGIDCQSKVQELGYFQYPSMIFMVWEAQWFDYYRNLMSEISSITQSPGAKTVPIYQQTIMSGPAYVNVTIPGAGSMEIGQWESAYLDLSLECPGPKDSSCPAWDRILSLYVCCNHTAGESYTNASSVCGQEVGRWITPFGRRIGRWITDITPLLPLFSPNGVLSDSQGSQEMVCTFQINCGTTENWVPTVNLLLEGPKLETQLPFQIVPLFEGATFDQNYNNRVPITFFVPSETVKVELVAVITGHGSDNNNCAEFCVTSHQFLFNNQVSFNRTFLNAGTPEGCADRVLQGVEPNEYGTWLYGRDGWCDGQEVKPLEWDITSSINMDPSTPNSVIYYGYYNDQTPDPT
eukprot:CAMPEP_0184347088 /NCGR_PEP_ID=MMETSP1089-20130417/15244_1 /TAXON_ID=38269 ORGANISM="Gloeochaete wittrockiana, Strain SAG46.84" /NCGR_SAMPLE_ID=MMETSP1089 /ASSEMBLY_ACC=CAM_ASM_000445 /LENGTH=381 /DNA_ID=CAMNT_0026678013 /DNA_START=25 /DNA_END=1166 /DNA_ORIENTATION=-